MLISKYWAIQAWTAGVAAYQSLFDVSPHVHMCPRISKPRSQYLSANSSHDHSLSSNSLLRNSKKCQNPELLSHSGELVSPWTQEPLCTAKLASGNTYCIFTSSTFANGRGISIFTTPFIATQLASTRAFTDNQVHVKIAAQSKHKFIRREIPGKGIGVFASETIQVGDRVFGYSPATLFHSAIFEEVPVDGKLGRLELLKETVNRLNPELKSKWWSLLGHFGGAIDPADDIINTNSFEEKFEGQEHFAVFPETARLNHDCRPNCQYFFDHATLTHYVHATTTILPGEEISISYTDPLVPRSERREAIRRSWGFHCTCSLCTQSLEQTRASDDRIASIHATEKLLDIWTSAQSRLDNGVSPRMAEYVAELYELERLWAPRAEGYYRCALAWSSVGAKWQAKKWAEKTIRVAMLNTGPHSIEVSDMQSLSESPDEHWSWKWMENH